MSRRTGKPSNVIPLQIHQGLNHATGEVIDVAMPATRGRRRKGRRKVFAMVDVESLNQLELTGFEWRVLHAIMARVNVETNWSKFAVIELARELGVVSPSVSRALRELRDRRIVETLGSGTHRVNPHIMFRGSNQDWDTATDTHPEPIWRRS